jgi:hypothetical protein
LKFDLGEEADALRREHGWRCSFGRLAEVGGHQDRPWKGHTDWFFTNHAIALE